MTQIDFEEFVYESYNPYLNHRCTQDENPREGVALISPKSLGRGSRLSGKIAWEATYLGFYCIFINKSFEIWLGGSYI
jgi:hypothetical protein